jgi:hypothetical protein
VMTRIEAGTWVTIFASAQAQTNAPFLTMYLCVYTSQHLYGTDTGSIGAPGVMEVNLSVGRMGGLDQPSWVQLFASK